MLFAVLEHWLPELAVNQWSVNLKLNAPGY
jgi:hypothetical protein